MSFRTEQDLRTWLMANHGSSRGIWLRIYRKDSGVESVTFDEVLDQGLCFGWSESQRIRGDEVSYLQRFSPRRTRGTKSRRNLEHVERLIQEGSMTTAGLTALGMSWAQERPRLEESQP